MVDQIYVYDNVSYDYDCFQAGVQLWRGNRWEVLSIFQGMVDMDNFKCTISLREVLESVRGINPDYPLQMDYKNPKFKARIRFYFNP